MNLAELVTEWNWDFDPKDEESLSFAVNEMIGYLSDMGDQDPEYLVALLLPFVERAIVEDLNNREEEE